MLVKYIFFLGLFLLPFIFWPWVEIPYEIPRVWFVHRWIEVLGFLGVVGVLRGTLTLKRRKIDTVLVFLVIAFVGVAFVSSYLGEDFGKSFWGNYWRWDGLFTLFHLVGFFFFLLLFWGDSWKRPAAIAIASGSFIVSIWTIVSGIRLHLLGDSSILNWNDALGATFGQPNFLAGYLLVTLPFFAYLSATTKNEKLKLFWSRAMILQALAIFLTFAWGAVLGIVIFAVGWLLLKKGLWVVKVIGGLALIVAVAGVAYWVWESKPKFALNETGTILTANPESRERMVVKGFLAFQERPILGWGFANFDYAFDSVVWPIPLGNDVYVDKGHSTIFELLVTTGVVGLGLYLLVVLWAVFRNYRMLKDDKGEYRVWQKTLLLVLLLYLFHSQTNVISIGEELMFWLVLGVVGSGSGER